MIVATPPPSWAPNATPYTQPRYRVSPSSLTCRRDVGSRDRNGLASYATATARATSSAPVRHAVPAGSSEPTAATAAPAAAPAVTAPIAKAVAVTLHENPRLRSPSGVMLASIDWPQGDHAARTAPRTASRQPTTAKSSPLTPAHRRPARFPQDRGSRDLQ